jgi:hypothetical protein
MFKKGLEILRFAYSKMWFPTSAFAAATICIACFSKFVHIWKEYFSWNYHIMAVMIVLKFTLVYRGSNWFGNA